MFQKVLIANRGEIAVRIIRTCQMLGIQTVAIYSEADADAPHIKMADEAYLLGGPRVVESYLHAEKVLDVARKSGADVIHPGYGFLSENSSFAEQCEAEGFVFIGPSSDVIARMGSKIESRKAMQAAGVPVVPGIAHSLADEEVAVQAAEEIGFPVMLKASAGGGGIGMQIVRNADELRKAFAGNQKRAASFFGDSAMYIEKYIENPRHIEIQILADKFGNVIHLWERECSIQRRHQKVLEEAPSPFLDDETRKKMGEAAVRAARAIGYSNAGTVEFLVDRNKNFYFLEMNTRLQVEHPVTEEITGLDLVAEQLKMAADYSLTMSQSDIKPRGHAIEARIYAEDPTTFFPSPGNITKLVFPDGPGVRNDVGVHHESTVTPFYDPMIAKLIVKGKDRDEAINRLQNALSAYEVEGIKTNIPLLKKIAEHPAFQQGETTTNFIEQYLQGETAK